MPTLFDIKSKRYAESPLDLDETLFRSNLLTIGLHSKVSERFPISDKKDDLENIGFGVFRLPTDEDIIDIARFIKRRYGGLTPLNGEILMKESVSKLSRVCRIFRAYDGSHVGHVIIFAFPFENDGDIKWLYSHGSERDFLKMRNTVLPFHMLRDDPVVFHVFSYYSVHSRYSFYLLREIIKFFFNEQHHINSKSAITWYPTTLNSLSVALELKMDALGIPQSETIRGTNLPMRLYGVKMRRFLKAFQAGNTGKNETK